MEMAMADPSLTLTPAKRSECEVVTHPEESPKRLHQSLPKDHGSDSSFDPTDGLFEDHPDKPLFEGAEESDEEGLFDDHPDRPVFEGAEESDEEVGVTDEVRNSEDYKEYCRITAQSEGYDCGSFNFPYFEYIIFQLSEERHQEFRVKYVLPFIDKYNKEQNRKLVLDSIEKVNMQHATCCFERYFVTFKVKDMDDGGALKTFQCSFMVFMAGPGLDQFREKPLPTATTI